MGTLSRVNTSALNAESAMPLLRRRPLVIAAAFSLATMVLLFVYLVLGALVVGGVGVALAATAESYTSARRASLVCSIGIGLTVGPCVYLLLAAVVAVS